MTSSEPTGLTATEARKRLVQTGANEAPRSSNRGALALFVRSLLSPLVLILVLSSAVSIALGDRISGGIILGIVVVSSILEFTQSFTDYLCILVCIHCKTTFSFVQ